LKRRNRLTVLVATMGIAQIAFAVQVRTWHGRGSWAGHPNNRIFVASWLASEMWIDPWLLLVGITTLIFAVVIFFMTRRPTDRA